MRGLALLLTVFAAWGAWFILRTSFLLEGERVFCLFDDAMISMAYARNLGEGYGLNWAREGEPVEGFTNPLWTAVMVPVNLSGLPLHLRSLAMQGVSVLVLLALLWSVGRLAGAHFAGGTAVADGAGAPPWLTAVLLTGTFYPLLYWTLMGMEVGLQALLLVLAVGAAMDLAASGHPGGAEERGGSGRRRFGATPVGLGARRPTGGTGGS